MADLSPEDIARLGRESLAFYIGAAHKTDMDAHERVMVPQPHHVKMINRMEQVAGIVLHTNPHWREWGPQRHTAIVAPPGSGKTVMLQGFYEWIIGQASLHWGEEWADNFHIGHVSHSADQAWRMSFAVRETIENSDVFKACFPNVKPSQKWAEKEWRVEGCVGLNPTFAALGVEGGMPGYRWNLAGWDDLIKPVDVRESAVTPKDVEDIIFTMREVGQRRLVEGGCSILANTRWFERDPTSWALDQGWEHILIQALIQNEDGEEESFWPERQLFTKATLLHERETNPEGFALQFQGEPSPATGITFKKEWLDYVYDQVPWRDAEDRLNYLVVDSWDTAGTKNARSDETAGWTAAISLRTWDIFLLNLYHDKLDMPELLDAIRGSSMSALRPQIIWIEDKSTGQPAVQLLAKEGIPVMPVKPYGERGQPRLQDVINQIKPMLATGRVQFPSERFRMAHGLGWVGDAKRALLAYPRGRHDDIARAFIQLLYESLKWQQQMGVYDPQEQSLAWAEPSGQRLVV